MNKTAFRAALAISLLTLAGGAQAADGTIDFTGSVTGSTCTINGGATNFSVALPPVSASTLQAAGSWAGRTPFQIKLTGCTPATGQVAAYFESGETVDPQTGRLILDAGGAENVQLALLNGSYQPIKAGAALGAQNSPYVDIDSGNATLNYYVQYESNGGATVGPATSRVQYTMTYQ